MAAQETKRALFIGSKGTGDQLYRAVLEALARCDVEIHVEHWEQEHAGSVLDRLAKELLTADVLLADVREESPNVFVEIGAFQSLGRPVVIFKEPEQQLPFDIGEQRALDVPPSPQGLKNNVWHEKVRKSVEDALKKPVTTPLSLAARVAGSLEPGGRLERTLEHLAWSGRLPRLEPKDVELDLHVFHLHRGIGRISSFADDENGTRVTVAFESAGMMGLPVPHDRLRLADVVPPLDD
jgi:hypothetical protein